MHNLNRKTIYLVNPLVEKLEITEIARAFRRFAFWDYFVTPFTLHPKP